MNNFFYFSDELKIELSSHIVIIDHVKYWLCFVFNRPFVNLSNVRRNILDAWKFRESN